MDAVAQARHAVNRPGPTFTADVLTWGVPRLRDLPWRRTRDPWAILVSEVMLQQTQVARVIPRWESFLDSLSDGRMRAPHRRSATCCGNGKGSAIRGGRATCTRRRSGSTELGDFPRDLAGLMALPGIGAYTARALLAFAFELDAAVVDTNIARVYARVAGDLADGARGAGAGRRGLPGRRRLGVEPVPDGSRSRAVPPRRAGLRSVSGAGRVLAGRSPEATTRRRAPAASAPVRRGSRAAIGRRAAG